MFILDFRRFKKKFKTPISIITLATSGILMGSSAYLLIWMVITICQTFNLSDSIVGYIFVAAATSMEETITTISICKRELKKYKLNVHNEIILIQNDKLNMIVSNCIGSNIFDLSIGLGLPYFFNSLFNGLYFSSVYSGNSLSFISIGQIICIILFLYLFLLNNFKLNLFFGIYVLLIWFIFTSLVVLIESNKNKNC